MKAVKRKKGRMGVEGRKKKNERRNIKDVCFFLKLAVLSAKRLLF